MAEASAEVRPLRPQKLRPKAYFPFFEAKLACTSARDHIGVTYCFSFTPQTKILM